MMKTSPSTATTSLSDKTGDQDNAAAAPPSLAVAEQPFLVFGQPDIGEDEIAAVVACLRSKWIGTGPVTRAFEEEFAAYVGAPAALAVSSCTAALHLALVTAGCGPGDEVIAPTMTFCSAVSVIAHVGATPVLVDSEVATQCITAEAIEAAVTPKTRAVIVNHMAGRACDMPAIMVMAKRHGLIVIEDCAHSIETMIDGQHVGTFGDYAAFSFYATKNVTAAEGGMLLARDPDALAKARITSLHGLSRDAWARYSSAGFKHYDVALLGFKYNMTDMASAMGRVQLASVEPRLKRRDAIWQRYSTELADLPLDLPPAPAEGTRHARHLYCIFVRDGAPLDRDGLLEGLKQAGIGTGVHYIPVHRHSYYRDTYGFVAEHYPVADDIGRRTLSLPLTSGMSDDDVTRTIAALRRLLQ